MSYRTGFKVTLRNCLEKQNKRSDQPEVKGKNGGTAIPDLKLYSEPQSTTKTGGVPTEVNLHRHGHLILIKDIKNGVFVKNGTFSNV